MAIIRADWQDVLSPSGLGDDWSIIPTSYTAYSIVDYSGSFAVPGFRKRVQKITRQARQTKDVGIYSNDFGISEMRSNYQLEFWYRAYTLPLVVLRRYGSLYTQIGEYSATYPSSTSAVQVIETIYGDGSPFNGLIFLMPSGKVTGTNFWFEIDRVSCREII